MKRLSELSNAELAEEARHRAQMVEETDAQMAKVLDALIERVQELDRRLDNA